MNPKVLIIFPHPPHSEQHTHYPYWHKLFAESEKKLNLAYLYESSQTINLKPFNLFERLVKIIQFRLKGYKNVYIHYSYATVVLSKIVSLFLPMKIYYWNCEKYTFRPKDILPTVLRMCDVLVTGSPSIGQSYKSIFGLNNKPILIVPNYVEKQTNIIKPKLEKGKIHILFVHHLSTRKGSKELPAIIKETLKAVPKCHFHIIGEGPDLEWLSTKTTKFKSNVFMYGAMSLNKVAGYFKACDYFIMPSRSEGFPRVILEAANARIPFVATNVGNIYEITSPLQSRFIVPPGKPKKFAKTLRSLIGAKNAKGIAQENYIIGKEYSLEKAKQAFVSMFDEQFTPKTTHIDYYKEISEKINSVFQETKNKAVVLDLGTSKRYAKEMKKLKWSIRPGQEYFALGYNPETSYGKENCDVGGDIQKLPFKNNAADVVICLEVIEHVYEPQQTVDEIWRVLKPGGHAIITTPFLFPFHGKSSSILNPSHGFYPDLWRYTYQGLEKLCDRFSQVEVAPFTGTYEHYAHQLALIHPIFSKAYKYVQPMLRKLSPPKKGCPTHRHIVIAQK